MKTQRAVLLLALILCLLGCAAAASASDAGYTVTYAFDTLIPRNALTQTLPQTVAGLHQGDVLSPDASDYFADGYLWSGWQAPEDVERLADGSLVMPAHDITLTGGWTVDTSALDIQPLDGWYTGQPQALILTGMAANDAAYIQLDGMPYVSMPDGRLELTDATDGTLAVKVHVERDGATVWERETTALIRPRALHFIIDALSFVYDGQPHEVGASIAPDATEGAGLAAGEHIGVRLSSASSQTYCTAGAVPVTVSEVDPYVVGENTKLSNYAITVTPGSIAITPRPATLTAPSGRFAYDAATHALLAEDIVADGFLDDVAGVTIAFSQGCDQRRVPGQQDVTLNAGTLALTPASPLPLGVTLAEQYQISLVPGTLAVEIGRKARVTLTANELTVVYNGAQQSAPEDGFTADGLPDGLRVTDVQAIGAGLAVGRYDIRLTGEARVWDTTVSPEIDVTEAYQIKTQNARLTIQKRPATFAVISQSLPYDGAEHCAALDISGLAEPDAAVYALTSDGFTLPGTYSVGFQKGSAGILLRADGSSVISNYDLQLTPGELTILPVDIACRVEHWTEGENGYTLAMATQATGQSGQPVAADALAVPMEGYAFAGADEQDAVYDFDTVVHLRYRKQRTLSYRINGAIPAAIQAPEAVTGLFTGDTVALESSGYDVPGYVWSGWSAASSIGAVTIENGRLVMPSGDVTVTGHWTADTSSLAVAPIDRFYNGNSESLAVTGLMEGDVACVQNGQALAPLSELTFTDACDTELTVCVLRDGHVVWSQPVRVRIRKRTLSYAIESVSHEYDAQPHQPAIHLVESGQEGEGLVGGELVTLALADTATRTYVTDGAVALGADSVTVAYENGAKAENYDVTVAPGSIAITPRVVTLVMPGGDFPYTGQKTAFSTEDIVFEQGRGFLDDVAGWDAAFAGGSGARRLPGEQEVTLDLNTLVLTPAADYENVSLSDQYAVSQVTGRLAIYAQAGAIALTLRAQPQSVVYDGLEHYAGEWGDAAYTAEGLPEGVTLSGVSLTGGGRNAGEYPVAFQGEPRLTDGGVDVTACFSVDMQGATLSIQPSPVTLSVEAVSYPYDGRPHSANWEATGVAPTDELLPALSGNDQTEVGQYAVTAQPQDLRLYTADDLHEDVTANYVIQSITGGSLTITPVQTPYTVRCMTMSGDVLDASSEETLYALNDGKPIDTAELVSARAFTGYVYDRAEPQGAAVASDGSTVVTLYYQKLLTVAYQYDGVVPSGAPPLPQSISGLRSGTLYQPDMTDRAMTGYRWNGWTVVKPEGLTLTDGALALSGGDVLLSGSWSALTDGLSVNAITGYYTGVAYALRLEGAMAGDQSYAVIDGQRSLMPDHAMEFTDALQKPVTVEVERDGAVIWRAETSVSILPRTVSYAIEAARYVYDGAPHAPALSDSTTGSWAEGYGLAQGQTIAAALAPSAQRTYVTAGAESVDGSAVELRYENGALAQNYNVLIEPGSIEIVRRPVALAAPSGSYPYDGQWHALDAQAVTAVDGQGFLPEIGGFSIGFAPLDTGAASGSRRAPGEQPTLLDIATLRLSPQTSAEGIDLLSQYEITVIPGTLAVSRVSGALPLTLKAQNIEWMYDGQTHDLPNGMAFTADGLPEGVTLGGVRVSAQAKWAGSYEIGFEGTPTLADGDVDVTDCFAIAYQPATLTVQKRPIRFVAGTAVYRYDGAEHAAVWAMDGVPDANGHTVGGLATGDTALATLTPQTSASAGTAVTSFASVQLTSDGQDASASYDIVSTTDGAIVITPVQTSYTVRYYYDDVLEHAASKPGFGSIGETLTHFTSGLRAGMRLERTVGLPLVLTDDPTKNIVELYYISNQFSLPPSSNAESAGGITAE